MTETTPDTATATLEESAPPKVRKVAKLTASEEGSVHPEPVASDAPAPLSVENRMIPIHLLLESPWNPRQVFPEAAMQELVERMRVSGFQSWCPLVVRPIPAPPEMEKFTIEPCYEIAAGHRRRRAAEIAGISEIPCIVQEMDDAAFLDVLNFDNSAREDVHPLHEAAGWQQWMDKTGNGVNDIAAKIGKSKEYVYVRLKLVAMIDPAKAAFLNGEITLGHAIQIARLQIPEQKKALKFCEAKDWRGAVKGVRDLAQFIQTDVHLEMADAQFDLDSADLVPSAGTCTACPKRTKNSPELIADRDFATEHYKDGKSEQGDGVVDTCTDPSCFQSKLQAHLVQIEAKLKAQGEQPVYVSGSYNKPKKGGALSKSDYQVVAEGTKGAKTAIVGDGGEAGKVIHIKVTPRPAASDPAAEQKKREQEEAQRKIAVDNERDVRLEIFKAIRSKVGPLGRVDIELLLYASVKGSRGDGLAEICAQHGIKFQKFREGESLAKALAGMADVDLFRVAVEVAVADDLDQFEIRDQLSKRHQPELLLAAAKRYKVDAAKIRKEVEASEKPDAPPADQKPMKVPPAKKPVTKKAAKPAKNAKPGKKAK